MAARRLIDERLAARKRIRPLTREDLRSAGFGSPHVHENREHRPDGTCFEWRGNGAIKTLKTRPGEFRWPIKYGMREYSAITENNVGDFHLARTCPVEEVDRLWYEAERKGEKPARRLTKTDWGLSRRRRTENHSHPTHPYSHPRSTKHRRK